MFTGLVQAKGTLVRRTMRGRDARLLLKGELVVPSKGGAPSGLESTDAIVLGESIAIDGVCLTVDAIV